jgi:hypothetical protein
MSSTLPSTTRKKVLALKADRLQKEIDLLKTQEELANISDDSLTIEPPSSSLSSSLNPFSPFAPTLAPTEAETISEKLVASKIAKSTAENKMIQYEADYVKAQASSGPGKEDWMNAAKSKYEKHRNLSLIESSAIADCLKRLGSLSAPSTALPATADNSTFLPINHKPIYDGHSG